LLKYPRNDFEKQRRTKGGGESELLAATGPNSKRKGGGERPRIRGILTTRGRTGSVQQGKTARFPWRKAVIGGAKKKKVKTLDHYQDQTNSDTQNGKCGGENPRENGYCIRPKKITKKGQGQAVSYPLGTGRVKTPKVQGKNVWGHGGEVSVTSRKINFLRAAKKRD